MADHVADPSTSQFWGRSICPYTLCRRTTKFDVVTHMEGLVFMGQQYAPTPKGRAPALSNPGFLPLSMTTLFKEERPNCAW